MLLPSDPTLEWVTPGHPLFEVVREDVVDRVAEHLRKGAIFYNLQSKEPAPWTPLPRRSRMVGATACTGDYSLSRPRCRAQ